MSVSEPVLALPNLLTLLRVPLAAAIWIAPEEPVYAAAVVGAAGTSDVIDGWFARTMRRQLWERRGDPGAYAAGSGAGKVLDPVCDKLFIVSTLAALFVAMHPPLGLVLLAGARELLVVPLMIGYRLLPGPWRVHGYDFTAGWPGKATTVAQFGFFGLVLLGHPALGWAALLAGGLGVFAVGYYVARAFRPPPAE